MSSSRMVSLFSERPELVQRPTSFVASVLAHGVGISLLSFGIIYTPEIRQPLVTKRYAVRHLDLHTPEEKARALAAQSVAYPGPQGAGPRESDYKPPTGPKMPQHAAVLRQTANAIKGPQTLIQPDITDTVRLMEETPVPTVVIWSPKKVVVKNIVAPLPEKATASDVKPSIKAPNDEVNLGDMGISSSATPTNRFPVLPSTTSPLVVHGPNMVQLPPVTTSQTTAQPTPTAVLSISDLRMADGTATLPPVNQTTVQNQSGILAPGQAAGGNTAEKPSGSGAVQGTGNAAQPNGNAGNKASVAPPAPANPSEAATAGDENALTTLHITLPKDGQFGAVIVGGGLEEKFPELSSIWNDRMAYTVYLHVGLRKSWIMQYSLPRTAEAAQAGNVMRLESPWPYNIVRPNIPSVSFSSDAILVHGFVNQQGRFEGLAIAFPPEFVHAQFVVDALSQWQFRPAVQNGQPTRVEVLLIIPEIDD